MNQMVSVIIPVYRSEGTLERCVCSLLHGEYKDLEILLIEDCSPDSSWEICKKLEETYPCVRAFRNEKNSGPSATRNRGLQEMTGTYLMFVDSDDWVEPNYVSSFVEAYQKMHPDMIVCGYVNHDEVQNASTEAFCWQEPEKIIHKPLKQELLSLYAGRLLQQIWNKFFLADIIRDNGILFDTSIYMGEDFRFLLAYLRCVAGDRLLLINLPLYHYMRNQGGSLMFRVGYESVEEPLKNLRKLYEIMGVADLEERLADDRKKTIENYAYLIMHNAGMPLKEKKRLILALDANQGKRLYRTNRMVYLKERVSRWLR